MPETSRVDPHARRRWAVLLPAMVLPFCAAFFYAVLFPGTTFGNSFYTGIKIWLVVWPALATGLILREKFVDRSREKRHGASLVPGVTFGLAVLGVLVFLVKATPLGAVVDENAENIAVFVEDLGMTEHYILFAVFLSFLHAFMEEWYWRWFAFGQARKVMPVGVAHLVAAAGFASHHVVILNQFFPLGWALFFGFCVGTGGAVWSLLYQRYNSLLGAWASHMIIDLGIMWVGWEALH